MRLNSFNSFAQVSRSILIACILALCIVGALGATDYSKYNARVGKKFLAEKEKEDGVVKTASGLLYKVLERGEGTRSPSSSDQVKVHYRGTLISGKEFDSSYSRGQPASFGVSGS